MALVEDLLWVFRIGMAEMFGQPVYGVCQTLLLFMAAVGVINSLRKAAVS